MDRCELCRQTEQWHREHRPQHAFRGSPGSLNAKEEKPKPQLQARVGGDPTLRMALIDAGVLTYEQLATAEGKLDAARASGGIAFGGPHTAGTGSDADQGVGVGPNLQPGNGASA